MPHDKYTQSPRERKNYAKAKNKSHSKKIRSDNEEIDYSTLDPNQLTPDQALSVINTWHELELSAMASGQDFTIGLRTVPTTIHKCLSSYHQTLCQIMAATCENDIENILQKKHKIIQGIFRLQRDMLIRATRLALAGVNESKDVFKNTIPDEPKKFKDLTMRYHNEAQSINKLRATQMRSYVQRKSTIDQIMLNKMWAYFKNPPMVKVDGKITVQIGFDEIPNDGEYEQKHQALLQKIIEDSGQDSLCCPITRQPFKHPVSAMDGKTYEQSAIEEWMSKNLIFDLDACKLINPTSPLTREPIDPLLIHCDAVQDQINALIADRNSVYQQHQNDNDRHNDLKKDS